MNKRLIAIIIAAVLIVGALIAVKLLCCNPNGDPAGTDPTAAPVVTDTEAAATPAPGDATAEPAESAEPAETGELVETGEPADTFDPDAWIDTHGEDIVIEVPTDQGSGGL